MAQDWFALLELPRDAGREVIERRLKEELRRWQRRTTNPDLSRRQEAERRLEQLGEARVVLLDDARRADLVAELAATDRSVPAPSSRTAAPTVPPAPAAPRPDGQDWLGQARRALAAGDHATAAYAAREARTAEPGSAEAWNLLARANTALGSYRDAVVEGSRATALRPDDPRLHFDLGLAYEGLRAWDDARRSYERAAALDPADDAPRLALAAVTAQGDAPERALPDLEDLHARGQDREGSGAVLADCLLRVAERIPRRRRAAGYVVTSRAEIDGMERLLHRARQVTRDPDLLRGVDRVEGYVRWCRSRHLRDLNRRSALGLALAVVAALVACYSFASLVLGPAGWKVVLLLVMLAVVAAFVLWWWTPGYVLNRAAPPGAAAPGSPAAPGGTATRGRAGG